MSASATQLRSSSKFARLIRRPPGEILARVWNAAESQFDRFCLPLRRDVVCLDAVHEKLEAVLPGYTTALFRRELSEFRDNLTERQAAVAKEENLGVFHNGSPALGELLYSITRALRPRTVVETGVAHGVTSCHILAALERNGEGALHSIDLPPLVDKSVENRVGILILPELRHRWTLHRGTSRQLLAPVCAQVGEVNVFVHDSLHTRATMLFEFGVALQRLSRPGVIVSDDVDLNGAFDELVRKSNPAFHAVIERSEVRGQIGICVFA